MTKPDPDHANDPETPGAKAEAATSQRATESTADRASDQAAALAAAASKEFDELKESLERALDDAGVDAAAIAQTAREKVTTVERLLKEEIEHRPLRTLAIAAAIGAVFGAIIAR